MPLFEPPGPGYVAPSVAELGSPLELGETPEGRRRVVPITGVRTPDTVRYDLYRLS